MKIEKYFNDKRLILIQGDITDSETDAIVNAANNHLWMGSGVAGAIKSKGGAEIEKEAIARGPIQIGEAVVTSAGKLKAKYVIHASVMGQDLQTNEKYIRDATLNSLKRAEELKLSSIAFPALGTGVGGFPIDKCAEVLIDTVREYLDESKSIKGVTFALFDEKTFDIFLEEMDNHKYQISDLQFVDNFVHLNALCRGAVTDCLWRQFEQVEDGDQIAFALEIYSVFQSRSEDIAKIMIALTKKMRQPNNSLFYYYCQKNTKQDFEQVYNILKTNSLDELLRNINFPTVTELKNSPNYGRLLKKEDYYQNQMDKVLKCLSSIMILRRPALFRDAYNAIKHGLKTIVWTDKQEFFLINNVTSRGESEIIAKGPILKLTKERTRRRSKTSATRSFVFIRHSSSVIRH